MKKFFVLSLLLILIAFAIAFLESIFPEYQDVFSWIAISSIVLYAALFFYLLDIKQRLWRFRYTRQTWNNRLLDTWFREKDVLAFCSRHENILEKADTQLSPFFAGERCILTWKMKQTGEMALLFTKADFVPLYRLRSIAPTIYDLFRNEMEDFGLKEKDV